jgi:hypothetical protein
VLCPAIDIVYPPQLAGDADAFAHVGPHAPLCEAVQSLVHRPAFFADEVAATSSSRSPLAGFAMYDDDPALLLVEPVAHAGHDVWYEGKGRRVMVREGVVVDAIVHLRVWVARPFGAKFPDGPIVAMLGVEKLYERVKRVAIGALRIRAARARCSDY